MAAFLNSATHHLSRCQRCSLLRLLLQSLFLFIITSRQYRSLLLLLLQIAIVIDGLARAILANRAQVKLDQLFALVTAATTAAYH